MALICRSLQGGDIPGDDEEYLSVIKPTELGRGCCVNGDCICAHFAFFTQREVLDRLDILDSYAAYMRGQWENDKIMAGVLKKMDGITSWIRDNKQEIHHRDIPYITPPTSKWGSIKKRISKIKVPVVYAKTIGSVYSSFKSSIKIRTV